MEISLCKNPLCDCKSTAPALKTCPKCGFDCTPYELDQVKPLSPGLAKAPSSEAKEIGEAPDMSKALAALQRCFLPRRSALVTKAGQEITRLSEKNGAVVEAVVKGKSEAGIGWHNLLAWRDWSEGAVKTFVAPEIEEDVDNIIFSALLRRGAASDFMRELVGFYNPRLKHRRSAIHAVIASACAEAGINYDGKPFWHSLLYFFRSHSVTERTLDLLNQIFIGELNKTLTKMIPSLTDKRLKIFLRTVELEMKDVAVVLRPGTFLEQKKNQVHDKYLDIIANRVEKLYRRVL